MMRKCLISLVVATFVVSCGPVSDQEPQAQGKLYPVVTSHGYGFIDSTGTMIVEPVDPPFTEAPSAFFNGLSAVMQGPTYGLVDSTGHIVILGQPYMINPTNAFNSDRAVFQSGDRYGYIDKRGNVVIPAKYRGATRFSEGLAAVREDDRKWRFIDTSGNVAIPHGYDGVTSFTGGLAGVRIDRHWGMIDPTGRMVVEATYFQLLGFAEGLFRFRSGPQGMWGIADTTGTVVLSPQYINITIPEDGVSRIKSADGEGLIDDRGRIIAEAVHKRVRATNNQTCWVETADGKYGLIGFDGNWRIPPRFDELQRASDGVAIVREGTRFGLVADDGRVLIEPQYAGLRFYSEGLVSFSRDGETWGYLDSLGAVVIEPRYSWCGRFSGGMAWFNEGGTQREDLVTTGGVWGWIDTSGNVVIEPRSFDLVGTFQGDLARVTRHGLRGVVNRSGEFVAEPLYDYAEIVNGLIHVRDKTTWGFMFDGYINSEGQFIWHPDQGKNYEPRK